MYKYTITLEDLFTFGPMGDFPIIYHITEYVMKNPQLSALDSTMIFIHIFRYMYLDKFETEENLPQSIERLFAKMHCNMA